MSLMRQIWVLLVGLVLLAFLGSFTVWMISSRSYLETQLRVKNSDNAQSLALTLSQQHGDAALMELVVSAQFDTGHYRSIRMFDAAGNPSYIRESEPGVGDDPSVPHWFENLIHIESTPGVAQLTDGWRALGRVEVVSHPGFAYAQLWDGSIQTALLLCVLGVIAGVLAMGGLARIRRPLDATIAQAQALEERRFVMVTEPRVPELARLSRAMNAMVLRLKSIFDEQLSQVEQLRFQAHCDPLTGVSHRSYFLSQLSAAVSRQDLGDPGALLLVRVMNLADINRSLGHRKTDDLLKRLAHALGTVRQGHVGEAVGRLNGSDFAVCVIAGQTVTQLAQSVCDSARKVCHDIDMRVAVVVAGVTWRLGAKVPDILTLVDEQLALAESRGAFSVQTHDEPDVQRVVYGEDAWRRMIQDAIAQRRIQLRGRSMIDRQYQSIHEEQSVWMQFEEGGPYEPDTHWKPFAQRTGQMASLNEAAVMLALESCSSDGRCRALSISPSSLADSGFIPRLRAAIASQGAYAHLLSLDIVEAAAADRFELVRELCKQLRPLGVHMGLEHAGERLAKIDQLFDAGLDYVKIDASLCSGLAEEPSRSAHVRGLVNMLHSLGLQVYAESVKDSSDLDALWVSGLDGVVLESEIARTS